MRSTPTWSTKDGGSHHGFCERRWGQARAGDDEVDMRKDGEVEGGGVVVLLRLQFLSYRQPWRLLFLSDQAGETKVQRDGAAMRARNGCKILSRLVFKPKLNAHSICAQESSLHTYHIENGYRITNVTIYNIFTE
jgi:hypothetical protein